MSHPFTAEEAFERLTWNFGSYTRVMNEREERRRHTRCSFCGKDQSQVHKLVAGPGVYICDQCIELCNQVLKEDSDTISRRTDEKSRSYGPSSGWRDWTRGWRGWFRNLFAVPANPARLN